MGWVTDTFGARVGFLSGGLVAAAAAAGVGLVLARAAGLRPQVDLRRGSGRPLVAFVPRDPDEHTEPAEHDEPAQAPEAAQRADSTPSPAL
jgi:hypothetical protein